MTAEPDRRAGVCLHVSSLPGHWGIGDIGGSARRFIDWSHESGLRVWQFLPIGPTGFGNSPYQLLSVYAGNPLFVDLAPLGELGLLTPGELGSYPSLPHEHVDYGRVIDTKQAYLAKAVDRFDARAPAGLLAEYEAFVATHDPVWLDDYALFATLKSAYAQAAWPQWDEPHRDRDESALARWRRSERAAIEAVKRVQFLFFHQWQALRAHAAERDVSLFGDLPIYLALDCAEAWRRPDLLHLDADGVPIEVAGVPPDYFSADGQYWGSPLYRWEAHEAEGFAWWIARLRHVLSMVDLVRLDHFRGFEAYWAIPASAATAREGQWKPGPGGRFFDAVRGALGSVPIVAEDLGVITEAVTALRKAFGIPGMQVLQFLVDREDFNLERIAEDCVCYTGTHDNDTTVGWFESAGEQPGQAVDHWQQRVLDNSGGDRENIHISMISLAFRSRARTAIAPMQDYLGLGSMARMNRPGQHGDHWQWRLRPAALASPDLAYLRAMIAETGRARHE